MGKDVWVTYDTPDDCQCWRDALCPHGWTWRPDDGSCRHFDMYIQPVCESFADAVRGLFSIEGAEAIGCLLRVRYSEGALNPHATMDVYVMRAGEPGLVDDHDAIDGPKPFAVISRDTLNSRTTPRSDPEGNRAFANEYRGR